MSTTTSCEHPPPSPQSPSPTIIHHPSPTLLPISPPLIANSAVGGAHYSGTHVSHRGQRRTSSGDHPTRGSISQQDVEAGRQRIMEDLKELYCCRPSLEIFQRTWRQDAIFEVCTDLFLCRTIECRQDRPNGQDPLVKCEGYDQYAPQVYGKQSLLLCSSRSCSRNGRLIPLKPKVFSQSKTLSSRIMLSTQSPNRLIYSQSQEYTLRFIGKKKRVDSIIVVDLDEDDRIIRLEDKWKGAEPPTHYGALFLRQTNARIIPWLVKVPKWQL
ncbi:hypothetical protein ID866_3206 [Astraeus odoratus]|nr:hypothetical protein ID866_3206 [Astraeus odoratus]